MLNPSLDSDKRVQKHAERTLVEISEKLSHIESAFPSLSEEEVAFVRARRSYLTPAQRTLFKSVLKIEATE